MSRRAAKADAAGESARKRRAAVRLGGGACCTTNGSLGSPCCAAADCMLSHRCCWSAEHAGRPVMLTVEARAGLDGRHLLKQWAGGGAEVQEMRMRKRTTSGVGAAAWTSGCQLASCSRAAVGLQVQCSAPITPLVAEMAQQHRCKTATTLTAGHNSQLNSACCITVWRTFGEAAQAFSPADANCLRYRVHPKAEA